MTKFKVSSGAYLLTAMISCAGPGGNIKPPPQPSPSAAPKPAEEAPKPKTKEKAPAVTAATAKISATTAKISADACKATIEAALAAQSRVSPRRRLSPALKALSQCKELSARLRRSAKAATSLPRAQRQTQLGLAVSKQLNQPALATSLLVSANIASQNPTKSLKAVIANLPNASPMALKWVDAATWAFLGLAAKELRSKKVGTPDLERLLLNAILALANEGERR